MALGAGSIAFVGFDADGNDGFAFVALEAIPAGQVIYFRDDEWNGTSFNTGEGRMSWTNDTGSAIAAGTVIELTNLSAGTLASSTGTAAKLSGSIALGNSDEALYAYTSTASDTAGTFTFLTAAANSTYSSAGASLAGTGLAAGTNALEFGNGFDVYAYDATTNGTAFDSQAAALAVLNNPAKWLSEDGSGNQDANGTVPDAPFLANSPLAGKSFSIGAASGEPDTPGSVQTFTPNPGTTKDSSDASAAIALDADWMIVGDDEANVLRVYPRAGGAAVAEWNYETNGPLLSGELDLEGATRIGNTLYFIGSHSNDKGGNEASSREAIFAVTVSGTGAATQFTYVDKYTGLESALGAWDASNAHGLGANHFGLAASAQNGVVPETVGGFSIEGLAASADGSQLLIAFRAPLEDTAARGHALIVPVETSSIFTATPVFDAPIELDLGGRGIRDIQRAPDGSFLIVAGPSGAATTDVTDDFRLFRWDGTSSTATSLDVALDPLLTATGGSFETIVEATSTAAGTLVQLLQDDGDTVWPGKSVASKDLPSSEQQFQGTWVELGANVTDTSGPVLASSAPSDGDAAVNGQSNIVLRFDEGVVRASGSFVIHRASDAGVVETIPAANAAFAYNTVTLDPAADLAEGTHYYIETTGTPVADHAGNAWAGLTGAEAFDFTTSAPPTVAKLLITEVNSNATGGDFFELYNYGTSAIDLTGYRYIDNGTSFASANAKTFPSMTLDAGAKLIVVANTTDVAAFRTAWNNLPAGVNVIALGGQGLGNPDAVFVYDSYGRVVSAFNYGSTDLTGSDGTVVHPAVRTDGGTISGTQHAGPSVGAGNNAVSAVWDETSVASPKYEPAQPGLFGGFAESGSANAIGSPGNPVGGSIAPAYTQPFTAALGDFTAYSVDADTSHTWSNSGGRATANGFNGSAPENDWLISKGFNLALTDAEFLSFTTTTRFLDNGIAGAELKVLYSANYSGSGSPAAATWTELPYTPSPENSQQTTSSGLIDLSHIAGTNVFFAFQYQSSGNATNSAAQWQVDDVKIEGYSGAALAIAATSAAKAEGDAGTTDFTFTVTRTGDTSGASSASWNVAGTGANPADAADFGGTLPSGVVDFAGGETSKTVTVHVSGDTQIESSEAFTVSLSGATGATVVQSSATGTIVADDVLITKISAIQGAGVSSPLTGNSVSIEGVVTAVMPGLKGFYVQEEAADSDGDASTSEGIFVYYGNTPPVGLDAGSVGDTVRFTANVSEFNHMTELSGISGFQVISDGDTSDLPPAVIVTLPVADMVNWESLEGMLVTVESATAGGDLVVTDNYNLGRYGQVTLSSDGVIEQYTENHAPSVPGYTAWEGEVQRDQIVVDDGNAAQDPDPIVYGRGGDPFGANNTLRAGDSVASVTGVVDQFADGTELAYQTTYRVQPTASLDFTGDPRPTSADIPSAVANAEVKVASVNVLNYFDTFGAADFTNPNGTVLEGRGADDAQELQRQQAKLVANILGLDADVVGLMEIQNDGFGDGTSAIDSLVDALNAVAGAGTYAYIAGPYADGNGAPAPTAGDDAIMVAILYKPGTVTPVGGAVVPDVTDPAYDAFTATYGNRVPLAQSFETNGDGDVFTVVVNHMKSKGSVNDPDIGDGQGANDQARLNAAHDLAAWLATNPTGISDPDVLLIGDFNSYGMEDPLAYLAGKGYQEVSSGQSYGFDGFWGSLDHALATSSMASQVAGTYTWEINAQEPGVLDYNTDFKSAGQQTSLYAPDPYRSSDHNPVLIGLNLSTSHEVTGGRGNDHLEGGDGNDTLSGGAGKDTMAGGAGDDTYYLQDADTVVETADGGTDTIVTLRSDTRPLAANVENLVLAGDARAGTGNALDNTITGTDGANKLDGLDGDDLLDSGGGNDNLDGGAGNDTLQGGSGDDRLFGRAGDDVLEGGAGNDLMDGGTGSDRFIVGSGSGTDTIRQWSAADVLVLESNLNGSGIVDAESALAHSHLVGRTNLEFDLGGGNTLTLTGVQAVEMHDLHIEFAS